MAANTSAPTPKALNLICRFFGHKLVPVFDQYPGMRFNRETTFRIDECKASTFEPYMKQVYRGARCTRCPMEYESLLPTPDMPPASFASGESR